MSVASPQSVCPSRHTDQYTVCLLPAGWRHDAGWPAAAQRPDLPQDAGGGFPLPQWAITNDCSVNYKYVGSSKIGCTARLHLGEVAVKGTARLSYYLL